MTYIVPIHEGVAIRDATCNSEICGQLVTEHLRRCLVEKGYGFLSSHGGIEAVESIKKTVAYVHQDYKHGLLTQENKRKRRNSYSPMDRKFGLASRRFTRLRASSPRVYLDFLPHLCIRPCSMLSIKAVIIFVKRCLKMLFWYV